jgi:hypothetical protein
MTGPTPRLRGRLVRLAVLGLVVSLAGGLLADVAWRHGRWHAEFEGVRFVDHREKIGGHAAAVTVVGTLVATIRSDVDFFALARADGGHPRVLASLCESGATLDAWPAPWPQASGAGAPPYRYAVLVPMRGAGGDLSKAKGDVCVRFVAATGAPLSWVKSKAVVVPVDAALRAELAAYARREGTVQIVMDEACTPTLCQPDFSPRDLRP